jgi:hypothetical protein
MGLDVFDHLGQKAAPGAPVAGRPKSSPFNAVPRQTRRLNPLCRFPSNVRSPASLSSFRSTPQRP